MFDLSLGMGVPFDKRVISRFITDFVSDLNSYGELTAPLSYAAGEDFDISFKAALLSVNTAQRPLGGTTDEIRIDVPNNRTRFIAGGIYRNFYNMFSVLNPKALLEYRFVRVNGEIELFINSMSFGAQGNNNAVSFLYLARYKDSYYHGVITDLIAKGIDCPLDESAEASHFGNRSAMFGAEEWGYELSGTVNDTYTLIVGTSWQGPKVIGKKYLVKFKVSQLTNNVAFRLSGFDKIITQPGEYEFVATVSETWGMLQFSSRYNTPTSIDLDYVSVKEISENTPLIIKKNINQAQTWKAEKVLDGWFSVVNLWQAPVLVGGAVYENDELTIMTSGELQSAYVPVGAEEHRIMGDAEIISGSIEMITDISSTAKGNTKVNQSGPFVFDFDPNGAIGIKRKYGAGLVNAKVTNIRSGRFLEAAHD